jgi:uncharacterized membrane protein YccC
MLGVIKRVAVYGVVLLVALAVARTLQSVETAPSRFVGTTLGVFLVLTFLVTVVRRFRTITTDLDGRR